MGRRKIDISLSNLTHFLSSYSLGSVMQSEVLLNELRMLHKLMYAMLCWHISLKQTRSDEDALLWFAEYISDLLQALLLYPQGLYKACYALNRSAIENFARYVLSVARTSPQESRSTRSLFECLSGLASDCANTELISRCTMLRQIYGKLSNYVHSSGSPYVSLSEALEQFPNHEPRKAAPCADSLSTTVQLINGCLLILEPDAFNNMHHNNKDAVLDCLKLSEKRVLVTSKLRAVSSWHF